MLLGVGGWAVAGGACCGTLVAAMVTTGVIGAAMARCGSVVDVIHTIVAASTVTINTIQATISSALAARWSSSDLLVQFAVVGALWLLILLSPS
jgi:hypothetical protein